MNLLIFQVYEQDGLPNMICHPCKYQLEKSYQFRKKCQAADAKLRKHMKLIQQLTGQDEEGENQDSNRDDSAGKSKQVKQLLADLVAMKGDSGEADGNPIEVTEEELVGGYILGMFLLTKTKAIFEDVYISIWFIYANVYHRYLIYRNEF